jgi:hypothetical protein
MAKAAVRQPIMKTSGELVPLREDQNIVGCHTKRGEEYVKKALVLSLVLLTGACSLMSTVGASDVRILRADGTHVILYDENGAIKTSAAADAAAKYCKVSGKTAELESRGGTPLECVSSQLNYCLTYICQ